MLKAIKELLVGSRETPVAPSSQRSLPVGYFMPLSAEQLLNTASRKQCLQQLWENSALPKDLYEQFYLSPLKQLVALMQVLPASQQGEFAREGGLTDVTLQTTTFAVRLAKGHLLPPGAAPEDQSAQSVLWNAVVFYAALWQYLPLFNQVEGELRSGCAWLPGVTVPAEPYRFRFRGSAPEPVLAASQSTLIAGRLLPAEVIVWLSTLPSAAQALMLIASRQPSSLPVIDDIVQEAVKLARGDGLSIAAPSVLVANLSPTPIPTHIPTVDLQSSVASVPAVESPPSGDITTPLGDVLLSSALDTPVNDKPLAEMVVAPELTIDVEEDTQALLSLMSVSVIAPANQEIQEEGDASQNSEDSLAPIIPSVIDDNTDLPDQRHEPERQLSEQPHNDHAGDVFWQWLSSGFKNGNITVNQWGSRAHRVGGFVFLCVPEIFHLYIKENGKESPDRNGLQKAFEKLGRHRVRKGQRFFIGHLYQVPAGMGSYRRINGYLVKADSLYGGGNIPEDSQLLVIP